MKEKVIKIESAPGGWTSRPVEAKMTGTWRTLRPVVDEEICVGCGLCEMYCPEASVRIVDQKARINYDYCKGCGVCANECPQDAIQMIPEIEVREESL
jgi:2-oxoacid:acceptor oxidoreductase delta subunit (pyruvate/2-ketoisovalerate family)